MDTQIFLNEFGSKKSVSNTSGLNVALGGKRRLLPSTDMSYVISAYDQYSKEREACNIIRLTCQVNPVCSNVLFNRVTEIVKDEGSSGLTMLNYGFSNTEASACGEDNASSYCIFDNVKYKPKTMEFWSGNTSQYTSMIESLSYETPLSEAVITLSETDGTTKPFGDSSGISCANAIRDMQLSKDDSKGSHFVYHCGLDIFNNHLIRSKTFKPVSKRESNESTEDYTAFNTIADVMRDVDGNKVIEKMYFPVSAQIDGNAKLIMRHLYEYDDIYTFDEAVENKLIEKYNGWFGFINSSKIKSYFDFDTNSSLGLERPLMYMNGGDFVDMYPSRDLYSFVPKWNNFKHRIEKNWNYCITYPSSSTTNGFDDIIETNDGVNSLKVMYFDENTRSDNGTAQLVMYSIAKHGLSKGDYVNIYKTYEESGETITERIIENAKVDEIVDDYIFTLFGADVQISDTWVEVSNDDIISGITISGDSASTLYVLDDETKDFFYEFNDDDGVIERYYIVNKRRGYNGYVNFDKDAQNISFKKVVNGIECEYYVRIFSRVPNFKFASGGTSEYDLYGEDNGLLKEYQDPKYDFESHVSRLAFAKNIYSDDIGEIVYTDDIDISNLKDNLGRPLSSVYLTLIKNNKGYKQWYGFTNSADTWNVSEVSGDSIEYSHCFGKITCAFDCCEESARDYRILNIKSINNNGMNIGYDCSLINGEREWGYDDKDIYHIDAQEIWYDYDTSYYGDLSYYDAFNAVERHIQPMLHRFNTAQRESNKSESTEYFNTYIYDEIKNDDYDKNDKYEIKTNTEKNVNNNNEGYYYVPHYEIPIKTFSTINSVMPMFLNIRSLVNTSNGTRITVLEKHFLGVGDKAMIYDTETDELYYCVTISGDNDKVFVCNIYDEEGNKTDRIPDLFASSDNLLRYRLFKIDNLNIPSYAHILRDGTCRFIWRDIINNGMNPSDKTIEEYPFTNGAFYINKRVNLYLKRQDPYDLYGLYSDDDILGREAKIENENNYVKEKDIVC